MTDREKRMLRALIVDDEPPARRRLYQLLNSIGRVEVAVAARSVDEALQRISPGEIDVAFLDIQMPKDDGFVFVEKVPFDVSIVFVTAYASFAVRAFDVAAVDYLLKPIEPERLDAAVTRVEADVARRQEGRGRGGLDGDRFYQSPDAFVSLPLTGGIRIVHINMIVCILASDDYTQVMLKDGSAELVSIPMKRWEDRLPSTHFMRVHRGAIVATSLIQRIQRVDGHFEARLTGMSDAVPVSRTVARRLRSELGV